MTAFYSTGTVEVTNGEARIWAEDPALWIPTNIKVGDTFQTAEIPPTVITNGPLFDDDEEKYYIDIAFPYAGSTATGVAYVILKTSSEWGTNQTLAEETAALIQAYAAGQITEDTLNAAVAAAVAAQLAAEAALDDFTDIWLGVQASDPATDTDGDPLANGMLYLNSVSGLVRIRAAGAWTNFNAGIQGIQGVGAGLQYTSMTSTTDSDPGGPGNFRFNNTDHSLATKAWLDNTDLNNVSQIATIDTWDDSTSTVKGYLFVWNRSNRAIFRLFAVTGAVVDKTGYREVPLAYVTGAGTLANGTATELVFIPKGDKGDAGAAGSTAGVPYTFSTTTTDSDPGAGVVRFSSATFGSIANVYFDNADSGGNAQTDWLDSLDDVTNANARGYLRAQSPTSPAIFVEFAVVGAVVDGSGYRKVPVSPISGAVPSDGQALVWVFAPSGADATGVDGTDPGILFNFDSSTTDSNPTAGFVRANHATLTSADKLFVSKTSRAGSSVAAFLATLADSTNPSVKGSGVVTRASDGAQIAFNITGLTDASGYVKVDIAAVDGAAVFDNNDAISFQFSRAGNQGSSGAGTFTGPESSTEDNFMSFNDASGGEGKDSGFSDASFAKVANNGSDFADKQAVFDNISLKGAGVASAPTVDLDTVTGSLIHITGTTPTSAITLTSGRYRRLIADAAWPITAGASLVLNNGGSNYTCVAGDQIDVFADGSTVRLTITPVSGTAPGAMPASYLDTDAALTANSDGKVASQKAVKSYIDGLALNLGKRDQVRAATTANITISTALNNGDTLDGVTLATGDLVLVKNQSSAAENGVYVVGVSPARSSQYDSWAEYPGSLISVYEGTTNGDTLWLCISNDGGTLGTTSLAFTKMVIAGELLASNNLSDVANAATARTNLGLAIGTNVQAYDADLTTWASLTPSANAQSLVTAANYAAMRALLDLEPDTDIPSLATGTFTPTLAFGGSSTGIAYGPRSAQWTKIGNIYFYSINIVLTSKGSATGTATVATLPVPVGPNTGFAISSSSSFTGLTGGLGALASAGAQTITIKNNGATGTTNANDTHFTNTSNFTITGYAHV